MISFLARRLLQALVVLFFVTLIIFVLQHLISSGPDLARALIGPRATAPQIRSFVDTYGLDHSLPRQYLDYMDQLFHGNLGYSFRQNQSVVSLIGHELPKDAILVGTSLALAALIAIPLGVLQASLRNSPIDYALTATAFVLYSMPSYVLGIILIGFLAIKEGLFPAEAPQSSSVSGVLAHPSGLVLPIATLTLINYALLSRYMRSSALQNLAQDYVRTARAKGLGTPAILLRHILKNSLIPVVTLLGLLFPTVITAGLVVEYVFNFPGLGLAFYNAAQSLDYPVEIGITLLIGIGTVLGNLAADIAYAALDPRVRLK